jgi:xylulokinase
MSVLMGIDVGTSSVKIMLCNDNGKVIGIEKRNYDTLIPKIGYAEQKPDIWWEETKKGIKSLNIKYPHEFSMICAIGLSGQMHGIIFVDKNGQSLRPAIIWLDQRSGKEVDHIKKEISSNKKMEEILQNPMHNGFAFPSLLWVKEKESKIYDSINTILFPKDYIRMKLTGKAAVEKTDASASLLFDIRKRNWAWEVIKMFSLPENIFSEVKESTDIAGTVIAQCASETGLKEGIPVVYGCGDHMAQSIGNGVIGEGLFTSNIGSGGQISTYSKKDIHDPKMRMHTFCHAIENAYIVFGATLCAGMSMNWLKNRVLRISNYDDLSKMASTVSPGSEGLIYLPYLSGERTPHMSSYAKGMFFGLLLGHDSRHIVRSVMEGVVFSLKDSLSILEEIGIVGDKIIASGGGATDDVWLQIQADILGKDVYINSVSEQACLGACILAGLGTGIFEDISIACKSMVKLRQKVYRPNTKNIEIYKRNYFIYRELYENNKKLMADIAD